MRNNSCWYKNVCTNECETFCIRYEEMKYLMENCNLPLNRLKPIELHIDKDSADYLAYCRLSDIKSNIMSFVSNGNNLYITSKTTGNGKTSWAIKLMFKYFDSVWPGNGFKPRALFIHVPSFLLKCKDFKNNDEEFEALKKRLMDIDLVVWDDIASTDISSYDLSQLLTYIDYRVLSSKANIFTGNMDSQQALDRVLGVKLSSRIWCNNTEIVKFVGKDRR